jgi:transcriptional regulator with XRE-family HTH domain
MSLRHSYAAVLRLLRTQKGLLQANLAGSLTQANISSLELAKNSATVDMSVQIAAALKVEPVTLLALAVASHEKRTVREVLLASLAEVETLGLADVQLPTEPQPLTTAVVKEARKKWLAVQDLKARGFSQSQAAKELGIPGSTLRRLWHRKSEG